MFPTKSPLPAFLLLSLTALPASAQIVVSRPALEVGIRAAALADGTASGIGASPQLTWNLSPKTSVELSADFQKPSYTTFSSVQRNVGFVQLKHAVYTPAGGRFFLTVGGAAGRERRTTLPSAFQYFSAPPQNSQRGLGGFTIGAGFDRPIGSRLSFSAETQLLVLDRVDVRTLAGVAMPLGRYGMHRETSARTSSRLAGLSAGDTVWV